MPRFKISVIFLIICCFLFSEGFSQSSPYSRYGIGDLYTTTNNSCVSMGGISLGYRSAYHVNYLNPASYTAFDTLSFVFEGGVLSSTVTQKTNALKEKNNYTSLSHLLFGFPVTKWWKASIGILPLSQVNYSIVDDEVEGFDDLELQYEGSGGLNAFYAGSGFSITKNLSLGFNVTYLFGTCNKDRAVVFTDSTTYKFNYRTVDGTAYSDLKLDFGLQYQQKVGKDLSLVTGLIFSNGTNIHVTRSYLQETYSLGSTGLIIPKDTIYYNSSQKGNVFIPLSYGIGFTLVKKEKWLVGFDYRFHQWEKYKYYGKSDSLKNSTEIALGCEYTPNYSGIGSYSKKMTYRAGLRYGNTYLQLRDKQLTEYAISAGIGFPLSKIRSTVNIGIEVGKRGTTSDNLIQDNFFRINLGVSICEHWFMRRKFE